MLQKIFFYRHINFFKIHNNLVVTSNSSKTVVLEKKIKNKSQNIIKKSKFFKLKKKIFNSS